MLFSSRECIFLGFFFSSTVQHNFHSFMCLILLFITINQKGLLYIALVLTSVFSFFFVLVSSSEIDGSIGESDYPKESGSKKR